MTQTMPTVEELDRWLQCLAGSEPFCADAERIDMLSALERLKAACAAAQARVAVSLDVSQRCIHAARGLPAERQGKGVSSQVALARKESPVKGGRLLGLAKALVREMPHTMAALAAGDINEWRATIMVRETATLTAEHRAGVDAELAGRLGALGDRGIQREARKIAYRLDPGSALRRTRGARSDRTVTIRPAPDTMSYLTGFLPAEQGIAVHAALTRHADALRAAGDPRGRGQLMADTLVERVTGQSRAAATPVEIQLVMTTGTLLSQDTTPARLAGYGPVPGSLARQIVRDSANAPGPAMAWVRRLFLAPASGELIAMESKRRAFPQSLRRFLVIRDEVCRTPWCDAPVRHGDHVHRAADGGRTSAENGQGLCEACNQVKEAPGWSSTVTRAGPSARHTVMVRTPTGHEYTSRAPDHPGQPGRGRVSLIRAACGTTESVVAARLAATVRGHRTSWPRAG
jgi:hypothetical protein